jgi:PncC family amidohydrolase
MKILKNLIKLLKTRELTIAMAESCTAGYASYLVTKVPGASQVFKGGIIVYSSEIKNKFFKIPFSLLKKTEGVSSSVALLLAQKVRRLCKSDIGASVVGFAGPGAKKGVKPGTVFIAVCDKARRNVKKIIIKGNRDVVRKKASLLLLAFIYKNIERGTNEYLV